jgi:hypothetical protein
MIAIEGRGFTAHDLRKALLASSGGKLTQAYWASLDAYLWELVEAVETIADLNRTDTDIENWL